VTAATLAPADCGLRGLALLDLAIHNIEVDPGSWAQDHYRCRSGMCIAGHICTLAGGRWYGPADGPAPVFLLPEPGDEAFRKAYSLAAGAQYFDSGAFTGPRGTTHAYLRALRLLGTFDDLGLFDALNDLDDIMVCRGTLVAAGLK
jgi:hypothetical protein